LAGSARAAARALSAAPDRVPVALGIANQRETCLFWDRRSGEPLHDAIVWQCRRSAPICEELRSRGLEDEIRKRTGLRLDPYFSGTKALWLVRNDASLVTRIASGAVCFGTVDSWLAYRLSGNRLHVTDTTNASRTLAFDIERLDWDDGLLELFGLRRAVMASARPSASTFGLTREPSRSRTACRLPPLLAISRPRSTGRPASGREWSRQRMAPAASSSLTRGRGPSIRRPGS